MNSAHPQTRRSQHGGTLLGFAFGLVVAFLVSFGVVWYLNKTPLPFVDRVLGSKENGAAKEPAKEGPIALPGKPGDKPAAAGERKFEFYDILEGKKQAAPAGAPAAATAPTAPTAPAAASAPPPAAAPQEAQAGKLFLQAGAFQKNADAENLKARLAMQGFEASILPVEVPDKGTMHRVRIGPYASMEEMNKARGQLSQNGIAATVVRVKE
jgi:cell division protein FtsN